MNYLSVDNLAKSYGDRILFENLSFGLNKGDRVALVANNGTGKSCLLKIITNQDYADSGTFTIRKGVRVGLLNQEPDFDSKLNIQECINENNSKQLKAIKKYQEALKSQSENYNQNSQKVFDEAAQKMDELNAWNYENNLKQILNKFKLNDLTKKITQLSGGEKKRMALAILLLDNPELLILDEPTNHLDVDMIEWLEKYLQQQNITLLMVTHDRYFLDRVCNHILELEGGKLYHHKGNYSYFIEKRTEREQVFDVELSKANKLMKKELDWIRRSPKARTTKSKSRVNNFEKIKKKASQGSKKQDLKLEIKMSRIGGKILELKKVYKKYPNTIILNGFDYTFKKGERIGIVGKNGVGKSTFLNIITQEEKVDSGKINIGETIVYGYFQQQGIRLKEDKRVIEVLKDIADVIVMANGSKISASQLLTHFMFPPKMQNTYVSKLSGGEKRRLYLLTILMKNPNFLILDEPTNDLDLLTLNKLEEFLLQFQGCLIIVSHDRYFMDKVTDHLFVFNGNGVIKDLNCTFSEYRQSISDESKSNSKLKQNSNNNEKSNLNKNVSYKLKFEYETLEKEIKTLEVRKVELEKELSHKIDYEKMNLISEELGDLIKELDEKTERWLTLDELM